MNEKITHFINEQTCATICCVDESGQPYCFSCFYAFDETHQYVYFKSSDDTTHAAIMQQNRLLSGTILPDKLNKLNIQGIQFKAVLVEEGEKGEHAFSTYYKKYPLALAMSGKIWTIRMNWIKFTDSSVGFGKKIVWDRSAGED